MPTEMQQVEERLNKIEEKLDSIDGKLSEKWFLPVFITVLTAMLALFSFFIQRRFTKADVSQNKQNEVIGQFIADSKVGFYKGCKNHLNDINEQFESYCKFGPSKEVETSLDSSLISFRKFILNQQVIDQNVILPVKKYAEFISESAFDISSGNVRNEERMRYYRESQLLLDESTKALNKEIQRILKQ